jgi:RNA polymerase sigma factor (sigma-70 family)
VAASYEEDVELARRCAAGDEAAWQRFILEYRPVLYRAADALDASGSARELADALYADLYGLGGTDGERRSLFRYYQGRSSLATWLRAVLSQRYVDQLRARKRLVPLPDDRESQDAYAAEGRDGIAVEPSSPDRPRHLALVRRALIAAIGRLADRDRLRLTWYYVETLTLAQIGRALKEHEATVSRQLARTRRALRDDVEGCLREQGMRDAEIAECFASAASDPGPLDLKQVLGTAGERKESVPDRSPI